MTTDGHCPTCGSDIPEVVRRLGDAVDSPLCDDGWHTRQAMTHKYSRTAVILELGTSETWTRDGGKASLIAAIEAIFNAEVDNPVQSGPGGARLQGLFIQTEYGEKADALHAHFDRMRKQYPLVGYAPDSAQPVSQDEVCERYHVGLTCQEYEEHLHRLAARTVSTGLERDGD